MIPPRYQDDQVTLYCGDCLEILPQFGAGSIDAVVTDPPYPDYYQDEYKYRFDLLNPLNKFSCRQFIFWTSRAEFTLSYSAIHIWDKKTGAGSEYERIFERNGQRNYKVFRHYLVNSVVAANMTGDVFNSHPSQKPIRLMIEILDKFTNTDDTILDPFMGSGTTGVAAVQLGRRFVGIEIDEKYYQIAEKRIREAQLQMRLPFD